MINKKKDIDKFEEKLKKIIMKLEIMPSDINEKQEKQLLKLKEKILKLKEKTKKLLIKYKYTIIEPIEKLVFCKIYGYKEGFDGEHLYKIKEIINTAIKNITSVKIQKIDLICICKRITKLIELIKESNFEWLQIEINSSYNNINFFKGE